MRSSGDQTENRLFDDWPDRYDSWFESPIGRLVKKYESELLLEMLAPRTGERILDVGCGTGVFTLDVLACGARIVGLDISLPMLFQAVRKTARRPFGAVAGNMAALPFADNCFDRVYSMTALEFVSDGAGAVAELDRVVRPGGTVVLTTLNSLSPWAERRRREAKAGHALFQHMTFRSPGELARLAPGDSTVKTAIHFLKSEDPERVAGIEQEGKAQRKDTGALVAIAWRKANRAGNETGSPLR